MKTVSFKNQNILFQQGDLIAWFELSGNLYQKFIVFLFKLVFKIKYSHLGILLLINGKYFVLSIGIPEIKLIPLEYKKTFYHIPIFLEWKNPYIDFLFSNLDEKITLIDFIRFVFGITSETSDRFQPAEFITTFYNSIGLRLYNTLNAKKLINFLISKYNTDIYCVVNSD